ncbi:unnamed protein product [Boreogadus saida]
MAPSTSADIINTYLEILQFIFFPSVSLRPDASCSTLTPRALHSLCTDTDIVFGDPRRPCAFKALSATRTA